MSTHRCTRPNAEEKKWYSPVPGKQYETRLMLRHQFGARYSNDLREPHGNAVKQIGCYLNSCLDQGIILKHDLDNLAIDLHVDADFAGSWNLQDSDDVNSVKSRTGCLLTSAGVPLLWKSSLQSQITLSSQKSEYIALNTGIRSPVQIRSLLSEIAANST